MTLSIVVVTWNSASCITDCLEAAVRCLSDERIDGEIVVVDNASSDETEEAVESVAGPIRFIALTENVGFGRANNIGFREAFGEFVLILNPDTRIDPACLSRSLQALASRSLPSPGIVAAKLYNESGVQSSHYEPHVLKNDALRLTGIGPLRSKLGNPRPRRRGAVEVGGVVGAYMMLPASVYAEVGGFAEDIFMFGEDVDLCYRVTRAGHHVYYLPSATCYHIHNASGIDDTSRYVRYFGGIRDFYTRHQTRLQYLLYLCLLLATYPARRTAIGVLGGTGGRRGRGRLLAEHVYAREAVADLAADPGFRRIGLVVVAGALAAVAIPWPWHALVLAVFGVLFWLAGRAEGRITFSRVDLLSPWVGYPAAFLLYYSVGLLIPLDYVGGRIPLTQGLLYLVAIAAYVLGVFVSGAKATAPRVPRGASLGDVPSIAGRRVPVLGIRGRAIGMVVVGLAATLYLLVSIGASTTAFRFSKAPGWTFYLVSMLIVGVFGLAVLQMWHPRGRRRTILLAALAAASAVMVSMLASRSPIFTGVLLAVIAFHYIVSRVRLRQVVALGLAMFMLISVMGFVRTVGGARAEGWYTANIARYGIPASAASLAPGLLAVRNGPGHLELIREAYPARMPYMYGRFSTMSVATLLPGSQPLPGQVLTEALFPERSLSEMGGVAPSVLGGFYVDGGLVAIAVGMFVTGLILGLAHRWMTSRPGPLTIAVYAVILSNFLLWIYGNFLTDPSVIWSSVLMVAMLCTPRLSTGRSLGSAAEHVEDRDVATVRSAL